MSYKNAALIVIDVQESFRNMPFWSTEGLDAYVERQQALIDGAAAAGIPVVQIFHNRAQSPLIRRAVLSARWRNYRFRPTSFFTSNAIRH